MHKKNLNGTWMLNAVSGREKDVPAQVPGDTHSALLEAGRIEDPYWGQNELDMQWIGDEDWDYARSFDADDRILGEDAVFLVCESLDTIAEVFINDVSVGSSENMFVRNVFEVKDELRPGTNDIRIRFKSPVEAARLEAEKQPYPIPYSQQVVGTPDRNLIRKVQCHSGWDWGCCLMVSGIAGEISLEATSKGRIDYVYSTQKHGAGFCELDVCCEFTAVNAGTDELVVEIDGTIARQSVELEEGLNKVNVSVTIDAPKLWWPNGHGEQPLYDMKVSLGGDDLTRRIGLREVELISERDDVGKSLIIRVNGQDIFCKGSDWIPCDALPQRVKREHLDDLLTSAAEANMNMLRIWGGGQYESDDFYELCDEKGLMIWQDFMFACAMYPADPNFLANVKCEAEHQIKRLRDYACIALWCGNNENLGALNWYKESRENRDRYLVDYDRLNEGVLGNAVMELDPTRSFWPSSPCAGPGDYTDCFHDPNSGDMHYWGVWHGGRSFDSYLDIIPRFCSEFGFQAFPSMEAIRNFTPRHQMNVTSPSLEHHQRNRSGNSKIIEMFSRYFRMPSGLENFVYLSQVQQGVAIKMGVEHWRRLRPTCMGTIIWQLNDNWPVASWSSIEYSGKWKLLHYFCKRFYEPILASVFQDKEGEVEICLTSDDLESHNAELSIQVWDFAGKMLSEETMTLDTPVAGATTIKKGKAEDFLAKASDGFMVLKLVCNGKTSYNDHFFTEYKRCDLEAAAIDTNVVEANGLFQVSLNTDKPAFFVSLNADDLRGEFDDNCITLVPGEERMLTFKPKQDLSLDAFKDALRVNNLFGSYQ